MLSLGSVGVRVQEVILNDNKKRYLLLDEVGGGNFHSKPREDRTFRKKLSTWLTLIGVMLFAIAGVMYGKTVQT